MLLETSSERYESHRDVSKISFVYSDVLYATVVSLDVLKMYQKRLLYDIKILKTSQKYSLFFRSQYVVVVLKVIRNVCCMLWMS